MSTLPLGLGAYKRTAGNMPEVKLINRFVESAPTNLKEKVALLARPGTTLLERFPPDTTEGRFRGVFSEIGVFGSDLFVVSGKNLYRYDGTTKTLISGEIQGTSKPSVSFDKGAGYERLFIADGLLLQYYEGGTHASGALTEDGGTKATAVLTDNGSATYTSAVIEVNGVYYGWNDSVDSGSPDGTSGNPWLCPVGAGGSEALSNMADMLNFDGTPGVDFSTDLPGASAYVSAESDATTLTVTALTVGTGPNSYTVSVTGDANLSWDGATLSGGSEADYSAALVAINGIYYGWNDDVDFGSPDGTSGNPFLCPVGAGGAAAMSNMADMLNFDGTPGVDFSSTISTHNPDVSASAAGLVLTVTARVETTAGNSITTTVSGDPHFSWSAATLEGGGVHALHGVQMPGGLPAKLTASLNHYVWVGIGDSQRHYYIRPGETVIDPLLFAEAESSPDGVLGMARVGDTMVLMGAASTEFWSATGNADTPFAPVQGRTLSRGIIEGTAVAVTESTILLVGNDGKVYAVTGSPQRISDHSMEERIRRQLRREAGLS